MQNPLPLAGILMIALMNSAYAAGKKQPEATQPAVQAKVWVAKPDGALSCGAKKGQTPEEMSGELKAAGVQIFEMRKGSDGKMHIQMCGAPTGSLNEFEILASDLPKAVGAGFKRLS